jgi:membrane protein required for colicin V production
MNWVDFTIVGIILVSGLIGLFRGFVREVLSLVAWIAAFWVALTFSQLLASYLRDVIESEAARHVVAFLVLFFGTLVVVALVNSLIMQVVHNTGIGGTDMTLGMIFGLTRGLLIVAILVLLADLTRMPQEPWWRESLLLPHFVNLAIWIRDLLPPEFADNFKLK